MKIFAFLLLIAFCGSIAASDGSSSEIEQLRNTVSTYEKILIQTNVRFEMARINKNLSELSGIVQSIKSHKFIIHQEEVIIHTAISSVNYFSFLKRVQLETLRINLQNIEKALDTIALEILGFQAGISDFQQFFVSEPLSVTLSFLQLESLQLVMSMDKVEKAIEDAILEHPVKADKKSLVLKMLLEVSSKAQNLQGQLYSTYILVVEQAKIDNKELDIVQKMHADYYINSLQYFVNFVKEFSNLFDRLIVSDAPKIF